MYRKKKKVRVYTCSLRSLTLLLAGSIEGKITFSY
jgi:hypothetical protein